MTELTKPIKRLCRRLRDRGRPVVIVILPGVEQIVFRRKGERKSLAVSLEACLYAAARIAADQREKERRAKRKATRR